MLIDFIRAIWPTLQSIHTLAIESDVNVDCAPSAEAYKLHNTTGTSPADFSLYFYFYCAGPAVTKKHLSKGAEAGIAVAAVVAAFLLLWLLFIFRKRRKARKEREKAPPYELCDRRGLANI